MRSRFQIDVKLNVIKGLVTLCFEQTPEWPTGPRPRYSAFTCAPPDGDQGLSASIIINAVQRRIADYMRGKPYGPPL